MKPNLSVWQTKPCTRCIKYKGKTEEEANRRSSLSSYYCRQCSSEYQRERISPNTDKLIRHLKEADFEHLLPLLDTLEKMLPTLPTIAAALCREIISQVRTLHESAALVVHYIAKAERDENERKKAELLLGLKLAMEHLDRNPKLKEEITRIRKELVRLGHKEVESEEVEEEKPTKGREASLEELGITEAEWAEFQAEIKRNNTTEE